MTNVNDSLNPIRPNNGEVSDIVQEELAETVAGQAGGTTDGDRKSDESRAEVDEEVRKPKPAVRPHTPTRLRSMSTRSHICRIEHGASIAFEDGAYRRHTDMEVEKRRWELL